MANLTQTYVEVARALVVPNAITLTHSYVEVARSLIEPPVFVRTELDLDADLSASIAAEADLEDQLTFSVVVTGFEQFNEDLEEEIEFVSVLNTPSAINLSQTYIEVARAVVIPNSISLTHSYVEVARSIVLPPAFIDVDLDLDGELSANVVGQSEVEEQLVFDASITTTDLSCLLVQSIWLTPILQRPSCSMRPSVKIVFSI